MIKLSGSRFTDIMPENLASQAEVQAIAYAVGRQVEKLCAYSDAARTYAAIATMPEWLLDYMAVELRTPSYDENYSIKTKRALIEGSLLFYTQMGTPAAVNRIIETIFETGYIGVVRVRRRSAPFPGLCGGRRRGRAGRAGGVPAGPGLRQAPFLLAG